MGKKELKRMLAMYMADLNSMADELACYRERAEKAENMADRLVRVILSAFDWSTRYQMLNVLVAEWRAYKPENFRETK